MSDADLLQEAAGIIDDAIVYLREVLNRADDREAVAKRIYAALTALEKQHAKLTPDPATEGSDR